MTFADDIERAAAEPIEAIVIGEYAPGWGFDEAPHPTAVRRGEVLSWDEARPMLDYDYSRDYGSPECDAVFVWTRSRVLFVSQYDGSTRVEFIPRHPTAEVDPTMPGR